MHKLSLVRRSLYSALAAPLLLSALSGCADSPAQEERARPATSGPIVTVPRHIDLGEVPAKSKHRIQFELRNRSSRPVALGPIFTSCDCLQIRRPSGLIEPGGKVDIVGTLDLAAEPEATALSIEVTGKSVDQASDFLFVVRVRVGN